MTTKTKKNSGYESKKIESKTILVTPLNWGLGHATRCMPIINELLTQNIKVIIASDGRASELLKKEYPNLQHLELPAYNVTYDKGNMVWNIGKQLPKIVFSIIKEWFVLQQLIKKHQIDAVISDNRYGCWSWKIPTVFITHQVNIKIPISWLERIVNVFNHLALRFFGAVWIPDLENEPNLAGELSHGFNLKHARYIGVLSRMKPLKISKQYDVGIILSGPEPQRTFLEKKLLKQVDYIHQNIDKTIKFLIVKGKTNLEQFEQSDNLEIHGYLTAKQLNQKMAACELIVTRSGYSTLMDLAILNKKAVLIPTPGQTEQEYLAENFFQKNIFYTQSQKDFDLKKVLKKDGKYKGFQQNFGSLALLQKRISELSKKM